MATDTEWARIGEDAKASGLTVSEYINRTLEAASASGASVAVGLPPSVLRRLTQAVLVLERLEMAAMGGTMGTSPTPRTP